MTKKEYDHQRYLKRKDAILERNKVYREANRDKLSSSNTEYFQENKIIIQAKRKEYYQRHPEKYREIHKKYRENHREECLSASRKSKYGIDSIEYNQLAESQNNVCAICGNPPKYNKTLDIDHDHATNKTRALLCRHCNMGLGHFNDQPELLEKAAQYLRRFQNLNLITKELIP